MASLSEALASGCCPVLASLNVGDNELTRFPEALCAVASLEELVLSENDVDRLPWGLLHLTRLRKLYLRSNRRLPQEAELLGWSPTNIAALFGYLRDLQYAHHAIPTAACVPAGIPL